MGTPRWGWGCSAAGDVGKTFEGHFGVLRAEVPRTESSSQWVPVVPSGCAVPWRGPQPPEPRSRERAPLPPYGSHERGSVRPAAPLAGAAVWLWHERAFQEGLRPARARKPEPGGASPRPDAQCPSVPGTWRGHRGPPPVSPPRGAAGSGERDVPPWSRVEGARMPREPADWKSPGSRAVPIPGGRS